MDDGHIRRQLNVGQVKLVSVKPSMGLCSFEIDELNSNRFNCYEVLRASSGPSILFPCPGGCI